MSSTDRHEVMKSAFICIPFEMRAIDIYPFFIAVYELSQLLNTGLDRETLAILMALLQKGVNPEALAAVVKDLRKEAKAGATRDSKRSSNWAISSRTSEESVQRENKSVRVPTKCITFQSDE